MEFKVDRFRDPVHGFIEVRPLEKEIIATRAFQRLRYIKQLALTSYVYHGAEHTRFGHSLGVMELATRAFRSAVGKQRYKFVKNIRDNRKKIEWLEQILRLIALTHDLGHAPFSHAAEELFSARKDGKGKLIKTSHEDMTREIIMHTEIAQIISEIGNKFKHELGDKYDITPEMICDIYSGNNIGNNSEFLFLNFFMDSELDCDKMDYLLRDSLYCGVNYGKYDLARLISSLTIYTGKDGNEPPRLCIESGGIQAFEAFVLARYFMFVDVYFHRTRRYYDIILSKALKECLPGGTFPCKVEEYLDWDDNKVLELLKAKSDKNEYARSIILRQHWSCIYETPTHPGQGERKVFDIIEKQFKKNLKKDYDKMILEDRSAVKYPLKFIPQRYELEDPNTIAIINKETGKASTIADESLIIRNLTEQIDIRRIYAHPTLKKQAEKIVKEI